MCARASGRFPNRGLCAGPWRGESASRLRTSLSQFAAALCVQTRVLLVFKAKCLGWGGLSLRCRSSKLGVPDVGYECFALQGQALGLRVPSPWWGPARVAVAVCRDCVSLLPAWMWPFSRLPCVKLLLSWLRVFFRGNCSVCRCSFSVPTGGGEFREVFCCDFESPLVLTVKTTSRSRHRPTWS